MVLESTATAERGIHVASDFLERIHPSRVKLAFLRLDHEFYTIKYTGQADKESL